MSGPTNKNRCQWGCWGLAALIGLVVFIVCLSRMYMHWPSALLISAIAFIVLGLLMSWLFCKGSSEHAESSSGSSRANDNVASSSSTGTVAAGAAAGSAAATASPTSDTTQSADSSAENASAAAESTTAHADLSTSAASEPAAVEIKASAELKGEAELAQRKGTWKYEGSSEDVAAKPDVVTAAATHEASTPDYDGDGISEGTNEGTRPEALSAARQGGADDLKRIKGIGPKLEKLCNELGFYHFDQIAAWSADEVAWVNANLAGFKGRVSRDNWVEQAKLLAEGGETEFSKRVDNGGVY